MRCGFWPLMHTSSGIHHKLSFLRLFCWRSREYPFFRGRVECSFVFLFELVHVFGKIPSLASGRSLLSVTASSWDLSSNFIAYGLRWWGTLTFIFPYDGPFFSRILAWRGVNLVNRTLWVGSKTFCIGFPRDFPPWEMSASETCATQPNCGTLFTIATAHSCHRFLFFLGRSSFWAFY